MTIDGRVGDPRSVTILSDRHFLVLIADNTPRAIFFVGRVAEL